jgi:hypothetical protein
MAKRIIRVIIFVFIYLFSCPFFFDKIYVLATPPTLDNFWEGRAKFSQEERVRFPGTPYNSELDFYYNTNDSGMAVIEDINNPGIIYYFAESWKGGSPTHLEPHLYKSTDGGKTFTHLTKLFDVLGPNETTCPSNSTYAYWADLNGQAKWCLFQMREPDIMFYNGNYYIVYESAAKSGSQMLIGPTVVKLPRLDINQPITIQHGVNFRQHPLFLTYDGNPNKSGNQETSASTPFWAPDNNGLYVFWVGIHPTNSTWQFVDVYRGHYTNTPGSSQANCPDPIWCYFSFDESLITNPNFAHLPSSFWESTSVDGKSIIKEENFYYLFYAGGNDPADPTKSGLNVVRSQGLTNWLRKSTVVTPEDLILYVEDGPDSRAGLYGKLVKINGEYYTYYIKSGPPLGNGAPIARIYRMKLVWKEQPPTPTPTSPSFSLSQGWNGIVWPEASGKKVSDIPTECPVAVAKENFWFTPFVGNFGGVNFEFEKDKTYFIKCNQAASWNF